MQNTITTSNVYGHLLTRPAAVPSALWGPAPPARRTSLRRRLARCWDTCGILTLMVSSAAYGVYALTHLA